MLITVKIGNIQKNREEMLTVIETPLGELIREMKLASDGNWRTSKSPIKRKEDVRKARCGFRTYCGITFVEEYFDQGSQFYRRERREPQFFLPRAHTRLFMWIARG